MTILITRPIEEALILQEKLDNFDTFIEPMTELHLMNIENFPAIQKPMNFILTSFNALKFLQKHKLHSNDAIKNSTFFTIGQKTAEMAKKLGFENVKIPASGNVQSLIELILEQNLKDECLYLRGNHISVDLKKSLGENGVMVKEAITYEMKETSKISKECEALIRLKKIKAILFFSKRAVEIFCKLTAGSHLQKQAQAFSFSQQISDLLQKNDWQKIVTCKTASEEEMLRIINERQFQ